MATDARIGSIGFVSTYPPTVCGLASYTASLLGAIAGDRGSRSGLGVVGLGDGGAAVREPDVAFNHRNGNGSSLRTAAEVLNAFDAVSIQHEFGIFGGRDGAEVIDLMARLIVPTAVTMHTVLDTPTNHQREVVDQLCARADRIVVMSQTALQRLVLRYGIDPHRVDVIPHGADTRFAGPSLVTGARPLALTWGLIGPGKGLELAIGAMVDLVDLDPLPRYLIAGATHPNVRDASGESYRQGLVSLVRRLGLEDLVEFDDQYLDREALARLVRSADVVVLPYESIEQVTSGVLVEAIAAAKPVVATRFPHAVEILSEGAGITVAHGDVAALGAALRLVLVDRDLAAGMAIEARRVANGWLWPDVGRRFGAMMATLVPSGRAAARRSGLELRRVAG